MAVCGSEFAMDGKVTYCGFVNDFTKVSPTFPLADILHRWNMEYKEKQRAYQIIPNLAHSRERRCKLLQFAAVFFGIFPIPIVVGSKRAKRRGWNAL